MHISICSPIQMCGLVRGWDSSDHTQPSTATGLIWSESNLYLCSNPDYSPSENRAQSVSSPDLEYSLWHHLTRSDCCGNSAWSHNSASSIAYSKSSACSLTHLQNLAWHCLVRNQSMHSCLIRLPSKWPCLNTKPSQLVSPIAGPSQRTH